MHYSHFWIKNNSLFPCKTLIFLDIYSRTFAYFLFYKLEISVCPCAWRSTGIWLRLPHHYSLLDSLSFGGDSWWEKAAKPCLLLIYVELWPCTETEYGQKVWTQLSLLLLLLIWNLHVNTTAWVRMVQIILMFFSSVIQSSFVPHFLPPSPTVFLLW